MVLGQKKGPLHNMLLSDESLLTFKQTYVKHKFSKQTYFEQPNGLKKFAFDNLLHKK